MSIHGFSVYIWGGSPEFKCKTIIILPEEGVSPDLEKIDVIITTMVLVKPL